MKNLTDQLIYFQDMTEQLLGGNSVKLNYQLQ